MTKPATTPAAWRLVACTPTPCYEWTAYGALPAELGANAPRPGAVCIAADGGTVSLHPAPARWLLPDVAPAVVAALDAAQRAQAGVLTDVTGKWRRLRFVATDRAAPAQAHPLSSGLPIELLLNDRDCAATWVFDCPVIVARCAEELETWIEASYEASFVELLATLGVEA